MTGEAREILMKAFWDVKQECGIALTNVDFELLCVHSVKDGKQCHCTGVKISGEAVKGGTDGS